MDNTNQVKNQPLATSSQGLGSDSDVPTSMPQHKIEEHMLFVRQNSKVKEEKAESGELRAKSGGEENNSVILGKSESRLNRDETPPQESLNVSDERDSGQAGMTILKKGQDDDNVQENMISDSGKSKEAEPMPSLSPDISEIVKATETPVEIEPDVEAAGVKEVSQLPQLSKDDLNVGLQHAKETVPVGAKYSPPFTNTKPQVTRDEAEEVDKKSLIFQDASKSDLWLKFLWLRYYELLDKKEKEEKSK